MQKTAYEMRISDWSSDVCSSDLELPTTSTVIRPNTILVALVVGVVVTVLSAIAPALRATRVRPLAAMREVAVDETGASKRRIVIGAVLVIFGLFSMSPALGEDPSTDVVPGVGLGAFALLIGVIVVGPVLVRPDRKSTRLNS